MKMRGVGAALAMSLSASAIGAGAPGPIPQHVAPPAPDYGVASSWAARPGMASATDAKRVDVFYIHPTTDRSVDRWNQDIADTQVNRWTDESVVARQASAFDACCRIFAPRYRQSTAGAFPNPVTRKAAFALAYGDVLHAFDEYLARDNGGRPFILVGHSQGAVHAAKLIEDRIDGTPIAKRMVAAYVVGIGLSQGDFGRSYKTILPCTTPTQTGCIVGWNSVLTSMADKAKFVGLLESAFTDRYGDVPGKALLCTNPLTFDQRRPIGTRKDSRGAAPGDPGFGPMQKLRPHSVSAICENGLLVVDPAPDLDLKPLPNGSMHYHDIGLFWADIRDNAIQRVKAFGKAHRR
jgi:pimeloyl-ACP methyl ester carboxylesterase